MADGGTGEKTEEPTPERLRKLRDEGNVPKSQDITAALSFVAVFAVLGKSFRMSSEAILGFTRECIALVADRPPDMGLLAIAVLMQGLWTLTRACAPALACAFILGIALNLAQVGFLFSTKPITPDLNRLNPINGLKNLFNMKKVVELIKTIIKFVLISYCSYMALKRSARDVTLILRSELFIGVKIMGHIIWDFVSKVGLAFVIIAAFDAFYQRLRFRKDNMMTKYDVKQEYKQSEGDPHYKSERKRMHQEILSGGGSQAAKNADVVVRNPDHIAIALKYDANEAQAPKILAKGERLWAEKIIAIAEANGVPIVRNVPLAQALNKLDVGDEIPEALYQAVAEVLTFVYTLAEQQKQKKRGK